MGTGGSRHGAGRPGWRRKLESCFRLDIPALRRHNVLTPGTWHGWQWTRDGERTGYVNIAAMSGHLRLSYTWTPYGSEPQRIEQFIGLERTACRFGGARDWLICPDCGCRRIALYGLNRRGRFACRVCMRLAYVSEALDRCGRLGRQQSKLERRLEQDERKPPRRRMRERTYRRLMERLDALEAAQDEEFTIALARIMARTGLTPEELFKPAK